MSNFIKMYATLDGRLNGMNFEEFKENGTGLSFGGFNFTCKVKDKTHYISFDWDSYVANVQDDGTLLLKEGEITYLGGTGELMDCYDEEYEEAGFSRCDLTAKVLADTTEINEFIVDYDTDEEYCENDYLNILNLCFEDETGIYHVSSDVLNRFNHDKTISITYNLMRKINQIKRILKEEFPTEATDEKAELVANRLYDQIMCEDKDV